MASLAGQFAGIVHFVVPDENGAALAAALQGLAGGELKVVVVTGTEGAGPAAEGRTINLELVGQDRPGIVRDLSKALARLSVSIEELETEITSAAMSGEHLFNARARLLVPGEVRTAELRRVLEGIANELMVDLTLDEAPRG